ncbi:hypothetical protein L195_g040639, partial [Trifolium pratense]
MAGTSAMQGQSNPESEKSKEDEDLKERSTKKSKFGNQQFSDPNRVPVNYSDLGDSEEQEGNKGGHMTYKNMVLGVSETVEGEKIDSEKEEDEMEEAEGEGLKVEERVLGTYPCPEIVLSRYEEKRIQRPWKRGVIVKLLGRRIGYKALETRLKQMWVRKGVINIIDLSNDYYLVTFSHEDDQYAALMDGPWFIYDHYLTVKEWSPNFHPASDTIEKVAVWVRISGLPIEYYDAKVLHFIGDRIGKTVRVDKNTLTQERGKYARLCVEVDLTNALLAMFTIKNRKYNVEYEGLHLLCITCGRFGHYKEGCPDKKKNQNGEDRISVGGGTDGSGTRGKGQHMAGDMVDGPWKVVQKPKRSKKGREKDMSAGDGGGSKGPSKFNVGTKNTGSRFEALISEEANLETNTGKNNNGDTVTEELPNLLGTKAPAII